MAMHQVLLYIRETPNEMTGHSPFFLMFGRCMPTKISNKIGMGQNPWMEPRKADKEYQQRTTTHKSREFKCGDEILFRHGKGSPFSNKGKIIKQVGRRTFQIETESGKRVFNRFNLQPIRKWSYNLRQRTSEKREEMLS